MLAVEQSGHSPRLPRRAGLGLWLLQNGPQQVSFFFPDALLRGGGGWNPYLLFFSFSTDADFSVSFLMAFFST